MARCGQGDCRSLSRQTRTQQLRPARSLSNFVVSKIPKYQLFTFSPRRIFIRLTRHVTLLEHLTYQNSPSPSNLRSSIHARSSSSTSSSFSIATYLNPPNQRLKNNLAKQIISECPRKTTKRPLPLPPPARSSPSSVSRDCESSHPSSPWCSWGFGIQGG